jgi:hypothetical protein
MLFSDLTLSRRLEAAEGYACAQFALARRRLFPDSGSEATRIAGADVVFDGPDSPTTQTFGLGMLEAATPDALDQIEQFFTTRNSTTQHEVSPFAGVETLQLLCDRGYRPIEVSNVLCRHVDTGAGAPGSSAGAKIAGAPGPSHLGIWEDSHEENAPGSPSIRVRVIGPDEAGLWTSVSTDAWTHEHPELEAFMRQTGALLVARQNSPCFLAEIDGRPAATGALLIHRGVALLAGAATLPKHRRRGLQSALFPPRMASAREPGCELAMMVADAGSNSQRNAQRAGFQIAYTRIKWQKDS